VSCVSAMAPQRTPVDGGGSMDDTGKTVTATTDIVILA
jgi:hypothetical protein